MLYALGDPISFAVLLVSFVLAVTLSGWIQSVTAARSGDRRPQLAGRTRLDPRRHVDPFGAVGAAIGGIGWATPLEPPDRRHRGAVVRVLLSGPLVNIAVGIAFLVLFRATGGAAFGAGGVQLQYGVETDLVGRLTLLFGLANLYTGALSLVPLPPLPGGRLLFALAPRTPGWEKAHHQLDERNIGVAVLLALLLIPLGGPQPLLPTILDALLGPLVNALTGG